MLGEVHDVEEELAARRPARRPGDGAAAPGSLPDDDLDVDDVTWVDVVPAADQVHRATVDRGAEELPPRVVRALSEDAVRHGAVLLHAVGAEGRVAIDPDPLDGRGGLEEAAIDLRHRPACGHRLVLARRERQ